MHTVIALTCGVEHLNKITFVLVMIKYLLLATTKVKCFAQRYMFTTSKNIYNRTFEDSPQNIKSMNFNHCMYTMPIYHHIDNIYDSMSYTVLDFHLGPKARADYQA